MVGTTFLGHWRRLSDVKRRSYLVSRLRFTFHEIHFTVFGSYSIVPRSAFSRPCFFLLSIRLV
jgi:hypothetical protein